MTRPLISVAAGLALGLAACAGDEPTQSARSPADPYPAQTTVAPAAQPTPLVQPPARTPVFPPQRRTEPGQLP